MSNTNTREALAGAVWNKLDAWAKARTSPENVADVLAALAATEQAPSESLCKPCRGSGVEGVEQHDCPECEGSGRKPEQAPAALKETGETDGRRTDKQGSASHGCVLGGGDASPHARRSRPALTVDALWESKEVMALNAELGLTMDQLHRLALAVLAAAPSVPEQAEPSRPDLLERLAESACGLLVVAGVGERAGGRSAGGCPLRSTPSSAIARRRNRLAAGTQEGKR